MKFKRVSIDGYGRLIGRTLEFSPGLQIIIGPNEQGKSTLRSFICDMLYGQKRSLTQRAYDDSNELHTPWTNPHQYGGVLLYSLDNGHDIEVSRIFDRRRESIQVFDHTIGSDITNHFERLRNREIDFATGHLGLCKTVFLGAATISHFSLEELGDQEALQQIRERLLALADSGTDSSSASTALRQLQDRIAMIGQPTARTKPLPAARQKLAQLQQEYEQSVALQRVLAQLTERRRALLDEVATLREDRIVLEDQLRLLDDLENAGRLQEAETLQNRIDSITQQSFALGAAREFPVELTPEVQRAENLVATAQVQLDRTQGEQIGLEQQIAEEQPSEESDTFTGQDIPEELENALNAALASQTAAWERSQETQALVESVQSRFQESQGVLSEMPDFSRLSLDPIEWFTQLSNSFGLAIRSREEERAVRDRLRAEIQQRRVTVAPGEEVFKNCPDFLERAREYDLQKRVREDQRLQRAQQLRMLEGAQEESAERAPAFLWLGILCGAFLTALLAAYFYVGKTAILYSAAVVGLALFYFLTSLIQARSRLKLLNQQLCALQSGGEPGEESGAGGPDTVESMMRAAGVESVRELEAMYDQYRDASAELAARQRILDEQEQRTAEYEQRVPMLLARLRETFATVGEHLETEEDVLSVTHGAIEKYQTYREAKRRVNEYRALLEKHQNELKRWTQLHAEACEKVKNIDDELRVLLRQYGFAQEQQYDSALAALRAFRQRAAQHREQRGRATLLREKLEALRLRFQLETADLEKRRKDLAVLLSRGGVNNLEQWRVLADQARQYRELREQRTALEAQLKTLLRGQTIHELRHRVETAGELPERPVFSREELRAQIAQVIETIDLRMKEEHALHLSITERAAGLRSLNEIEEERSAVFRQVGALELELEAASHAMTLIEHIAADTHARIAPLLAAHAGRYLREITGGAYEELAISRDLDISVRIPQTGRFDAEPEKALSKGTVDQIYLALRLAFVQAISETGESIPMLLDDPFANYDNNRLEHTMALLARIGEQHQILLFTCREDVAETGQVAGAPVIRL